MGASSVTGVSGPGDSGKMTTNELNEAVAEIQRMLDQMPIVIYSTSEAAVDSGGGPEVTFTLPQPTPLDADAYSVFVSVEGGSGYVSGITDDGDGKMTSVTIAATVEDTVWIAIVRKGEWFW